MTRMERFEKIWADQHAVPPESLLQYRWVTQEGYRLPAMAAHFRTFCETLDSLVIDLPEKCEYADPQGEYAKGYRQGMRAIIDKAEAAGLKVAS